MLQGPGQGTGLPLRPGRVRVGPGYSSGAAAFTRGVIRRVPFVSTNTLSPFFSPTPLIQALGMQMAHDPRPRAMTVRSCAVPIY